jgi:hypothetical protein
MDNPCPPLQYEFLILLVCVESVGQQGRMGLPESNILGTIADCKAVVAIDDVVAFKELVSTASGET